MGIMEIITWAAEDVSCPIKIELLLKWYHNFKVPGICVIIAYRYFDTNPAGLVATTVGSLPDTFLPDDYIITQVHRLNFPKPQDRIEAKQ